MVHSRFLSFSLAATLFCAASFSLAQQSASFDAAVERAARHSTEEWLTFSPHLPDPQAASPAQLQVAGDVLRARRYPEEAIEYFGYALKRGGDEPTLMNRIGVTELENGHIPAARACFKRAILLKRKYAESWNNLGATENMNGNYRAAVEDYLKAVKFDSHNAVFHANLGTAYIALRNYEDARRHYQMAIKLDPAVFHHSGYGGSMVHVLATDDRGRFGFEMARLAAEQREDESMLHWLGVAVEAGFDIDREMSNFKEFDSYRKDPRLLMLLSNAKMLRSNKVALSEPLKSLPAPDARMN